MNPNQNLHPPRHLLETLAVDQDPSRAPQARRHVAGCRDCRSRLDDIGRARAAYLAAYPAADFARQVTARAERSRRAHTAATGAVPGDRSVVGWGRRLWLAGAGGLVLALGAVVLLAIPSSRAPLEPDEIRLKGGVTWSVFANRRTRTWPVTDGEALKPGDHLAFAYAVPQDRYLVLLGIDDAGTITQYGPDGSPVRLTRGQGRVPFAIELDARPGEEQLIALFSQTPLDVAAAKQVLAAAAATARAGNRHVTAADLKLSAEIVISRFKKP
jgi:hypothetical protein